MRCCKGASPVPWSLLLLLLCTRRADAHPGDAVTPDNWLTAWSFEWYVVLPLLLGSTIFARGVARLWQTAGVGRGVSRRQACCYASGMGVLAIALLSPLDALGGSLFAAHMTQHQLLMVVAPPLLVLGAPSIGLLWGVPVRARRPVGRVMARLVRSRTWMLLTRPLVAWCLHAAAVWIWHAPPLYERTLFSDATHALQHLCFTGSALLFWWTVLRPRPQQEAIGVLSLVTTAFHTSILAALLTFSARPWYLAYAGRTHAWGLSLLEDQQLGGLIMWIPSGVVYTGIALWMMMAWLVSMDRRTSHTRSRVVGVT
jgi:putative membrane protein